MVYNMEELVMSDGRVNCFHKWLPDCPKDDIKAVIILSHGMTEYAFRYNDFAKKLTDAGFAFYGEDHRGHGNTAQKAVTDGTGMFGYLADKDGFFRVVEDLKEETEILRNEYKGKKIFLFGHSFGSFVSQCLMEKYGSLFDGVILSGSSGPKSESAIGLALAKTIAFFIGKKKISKLMAKTTFLNYGSDWLTRDESALKAYYSDPWCNYTSTISFYVDLLTGLCFIHKKTNIKKIPVELPVFLAVGTKDPVGKYGKSVAALAEIYKKNGMKDVSLKLYEDFRHELINDIGKDTVMDDFINWFKSHL